MKQYFDFNLKGIRLLPYFLIIILSFFLCNPVSPDLMFPSVGIVNSISTLLQQIIIMGIYALIIPLCINAIIYNNTNLHFTGKKWTLLGKLIGNSLLGIITLGLYIPWFYKNIARYCATNTKLSENNFEFNGKPVSLLAYMVLALYVPLCIVIVLIYTLLGDYEFDLTFALFFSTIIMLVLTPFMFYIYKWLIDFTYKDYSIRLHVNNFDGCFHVFAQVFLSIITCGLYLPWAMMFIYKYFVEHTIATSNDRERRFGYEGNIWIDGVYILGQSLLMIITLFIYSPWATINIYQRIFRKTYLTV